MLRSYPSNTLTHIMVTLDISGALGTLRAHFTPDISGAPGTEKVNTVLLHMMLNIIVCKHKSITRIVSEI